LWLSEEFTGEAEHPLLETPAPAEALRDQNSAPIVEAESATVEHLVVK